MRVKLTSLLGEIMASSISDTYSYFQMETSSIASFQWVSCFNPWPAGTHCPTEPLFYWTELVRMSSTTQTLGRWSSQRQLLVACHLPVTAHTHLSTIVKEAAICRVWKPAYSQWGFLLHLLGTQPSQRRCFCFHYSSKLVRISRIIQSHGFFPQIQLWLANGLLMSVTEHTHR